MDENMPATCPLCLISGQAAVVNGADGRRYHHCHRCALIFADPKHHLCAQEERAHYTTHQNSVENDGYVRFLNRLLEPMLPYLEVGMKGLDYGCGPGPVLSQLVRRQGITCEDYDPFFARHALQPPYDFIFASECFEHFYHPHEEISRLCALLKPGGLLGIMTERWTTLEQFAGWYYTKDPTHTCFYHEETFGFLCRQFDLALLCRDERSVVILQARGNQ